MRKSFLPKSDESLLRWSLNFSTLISASPLLFGLTASLASSYATLHASFAAGVAACDAGERNRSAVLTKNAARAALKTQAGLLSKLVEGTGSVTDAQKAQLGLNVRKTPTHVAMSIAWVWCCTRCSPASGRFAASCGWFCFKCCTKSRFLHAG